MTAFVPHLGAIRFGTGRAPSEADPASVEQMLTALEGPDDMAARFPIEGLDALRPDLERARALRIAIRDGKAKASEQKVLNQEIREAERLRWINDLAATVARGVAAPDGFRERLTLFWADHFAVEGRGVYLSKRTDTFTEEAIRPHVADDFATLLKAATLHPVMLQYLDQTSSIGPSSQQATRMKQTGRGLNENLAREILELHTLGVSGAYTQADVRQFAELLAGVTIDALRETVFLPGRAEPGAEHVLGYASSPRWERMSDVTDFLDYLARRPDTGAHIARKLAVHFVADDPDPDLVAVMTARFVETDGDLGAVYEAMLSHPAAMAPDLVKVKRPVEFVISSLRALGADPGALVALARDRPRRFFNWIERPMRFMGQTWTKPGGPDGWPETASEWITPNTLAERIRWAVRIQTMPELGQAEPQTLLTTALGPLVDKRLAFAVGGAETREEAGALVLMSPAFQRR